MIRSLAAATALDLLADDSAASKLMARDAVETLERRAAGLARQVALSHGGDLILQPAAAGRGADFRFVLGR